jgi:hypothetical protein
MRQGHRKIFGVSLGLNSTAMMFDQGLIGSLGLKAPPMT